MLRNLSIQNYVLIRELSFIPDDAHTVITGETGAGKSMLLGALGLVLGERADTQSLLDPEKKCVIEASFDTPETDLQIFFSEHDLDHETVSIFRREILPGGKSRAFVNDTPVTLSILKELGSFMIDIHSQHDALKVNREDFQVGILDLLGNQEKTLDVYQDRFRALKGERKKLWQLEEQKQQETADADYRAFLLDELEKASLDPTQDQELEKNLEESEHAEEISKTFREVGHVLDGEEYSLLNLVATIQKQLDSISSFSSDAKAYSERFRSLFLDIQDLHREIARKGEQAEYDPQKLAEMRERMDLIQHLMSKHKVHTLEELVSLAEDLAQAQGAFDRIDLEISESKKTIASLEIECQALADTLSINREKQGEHLETAIRQLLSRLGMPHGMIRVQQTTTELNMLGKDQVTFLFTANKGQEPRPIKDTASGGELSRLMLALKYLVADRSSLPTIIFDEIDTGVGGEIAIQMGLMLQKISETHQIITITHLPQVASRGHAHYKVWKDEEGEHSITRIQELKPEERVKEIAEMIGGKSLSDHALTSAKELLNLNNESWEKTF